MRNRYSYGPKILKTTLTVAADNSPAEFKTEADYVCDGTDDQNQIQAAIDSLSATGGIVQLLNGTYNTTNSIKLPDYTVLTGIGAATIIKTSRSAISVIENEDNTNGNTYIEVRDLTLDSKLQEISGPGSFQVLFVNCSNVTVTNLNFDSAFSATFTAAAADDTITSTDHGLVNTDRVRVTTSDTLPAGLATYTDYYVRDKTDNTFKLSETVDGSAVDITDTGTGTHTWIHSTSGDDISVRDCTYCQIKNININGGKHGIYIGDGSSHITVSDVISRNCQMEHICIETGSETGDYNAYITVDNVTGYNAGQHGIFVNYARNIAITNCTLYNSTANGIILQNDCEEVVVSNVIIDRILSDTKACFNTSATASKISVSNCIFANSACNGITAEGDDIAISNCRVLDSTENGMQFDGDRINISNCIIDTAKWGMYFKGADILVDNSTCMNTAAYGIYTTSVLNLTIRGCLFKTIGTIIYGGHAPNKNFIFTNNIIDDFTNVNTLNLKGTNIIVMGNSWVNPPDSLTRLIYIYNTCDYVWITNNDFSVADSPIDDEGTNVTKTPNMTQAE